jgi:hypothetical protein
MNPRQYAVYAASAVTVTRAPAAQRQASTVHEMLQSGQSRPMRTT